MKRRSILVLAVVLGTLVCTISSMASNQADINIDNKVDWLDIKMVADEWLSTDAAVVDIDDSGTVNFGDFAIVLNNWLWVGPLGNMVLIDGGEFEMGDHHDGASNARVHTVYVDSFYMSRYETTNRQYCDYLNAALSQGLIEVRSDIVYAAPDGTDVHCDTHASSTESQIDFSGGVFSVRTKNSVDMNDHPMVQVSWNGAVAYCSYYDYRLPTEAEWEYAARGGNNDPNYRYPWGDSIDGSNANYLTSGDPYEGEAWPRTTPVGYYDSNQVPTGTDMANGYGLYDMSGNVSEWCNDWYSSSYYNSSPYSNPPGPASGTFRVIRDGSWAVLANECTVATRSNRSSGFLGKGYGFRAVLDLE